MTFNSQGGQDRWVYAMTDGGKGAFYLDIGCNHPIAINNTYVFEQLGWDGILVDVLPGCEVRKGKFFQCDASKPTPELLEAYRTMPNVVDFLSLDVDEATLGAFDTLPWSTHRFRLACIEHDAYVRGYETRDRLREQMEAMGYDLVCADVCVRFPDESCAPGPWEDWWCCPDLVKPKLVKRFKCSGREWREIVKDV